MFKSFDLKLERIIGSQEAGQRLYEDQKKEVATSLDPFLNVEGTLSAAKLQEHWFPNIRADIFVSHSHADLATAIAFAEWLHRVFRLRAFVDSCIWGHFVELQKRIDQKYCWNADSETFDYSKRNRSTSHVHSILSAALWKMIDNTECLFFLNTPQSIQTRDLQSQTFSPWIFSEINMAGLVRKRSPDYHRSLVKKAATAKLSESHLEVSYDLDLSQLTQLSQNDLNRWEQSMNVLPRPHGLDSLYELKRKSQILR